MKLTKSGETFVKVASKRYGIGAHITRNDINVITAEYPDLDFPFWLVNKPECRASDGKFMLPVLDGQQVEYQLEKEFSEMDLTSNVVPITKAKHDDGSDVAIPEKHPDYVPFGFYTHLRAIVHSNDFYPVFITGLSGNGKTLMVEQICNALQRECIRVNISIETDETDLLGGPTLLNGNVVNRDGPVLQAMKRGAILLIDEVDRGSNKLMCLQGILEGKPYFNKKSGEVVYPEEGFNVIATANTKGRGSEEGRYLSQILDDAFLERFPITVEQEYPDITTEVKILTPLIDDPDFVTKLTKWAEIVRKSFEQGAVNELISTRRLVHIAKAYKIFKDRLTAIELCVNRFDEETKTAFIDLYTKVDAQVEAAKKPKVQEAVKKASTVRGDEEIPF